MTEVKDTERENRTKVYVTGRTIENMHSPETSTIKEERRREKGSRDVPSEGTEEIQIPIYN